MKVCTNVYTVIKKGSYFSVMTSSVEVRILFLTDSILCIRIGFDDDFVERSYSLVMTAWGDRMDNFLKGHRTWVEVADAILSGGGREAVIEGRIPKVVVEKDPFHICVYDKEGTLLHTDIVDLAYVGDSNHRQTRASEISPEDCFYGFGEKNGSSNKAQKFMSTSPKDIMRYNPREVDSLYKHIPFYVKLNRGIRKAVGYFYHSACECDLDMGHEKSNYWKPHSRHRTNGGDIDLFLITGPPVRQVMERYTDLIGKSTILLRHTLRYLGPSMYYPELDNDYDDAILDFIDTIRKRKIPVDGFQLSSGYYTVETDKGIRRCVFTWNKKRFKDPGEFFAQMEKRRVTVSPNVRLGILLIHPRLNEMKARGMSIKASDSDEPGIGTWRGGKGVFADFTNPSTRTYWKEMLRENVLGYGTSSMWDDNYEYDSPVDKGCRRDFEGRGGTIGQLKSVMPNTMYHITGGTIHETLTDTRPYIVYRSDHCGIQHYAQTWAGDNLIYWDSLKYNIVIILGTSLSGVANQNCDIGGSRGPSSEAELMVRWTRNGTFQPCLSVHSTNTDNTVTEPRVYGDYTDYILEAIRLYYQLSPCPYSPMERAHETGLPITEPTCSAFQEDVECYEEGVDFMLGSSLLMVNMVEKGAASRKVYLSEDETFYDFYTRVVYEGERTMELPVDLGSIPLLVRSGTIIPMAGDRLDNLKTQQAKHIWILCAADRDSRSELYEDDGTSMDYEKGSCLETSITMTAEGRTVLDFYQEGHYETAVKTLYLGMVHREKAPYWVKVGGEIIPHFLHRRKFEDTDCEWYYSQRFKFVQIKHPDPKKDYQVIIPLKQLDLIGM